MSATIVDPDGGSDFVRMLRTDFHTAIDRAEARGAAAERDRLIALAEGMATTYESNLTEHEAESGFGSPYTIVTESDPASVALREFIRRAKEGA